VGGESVGDLAVKRPLNPGEGICYRINGHSALGEAARGGGPTNHDMEGESIGELIGNYDPCAGWAPCRDEGWASAREPCERGGEIGEAMRVRLAH
jgi:hypothetical protein